MSTSRQTFTQVKDILKKLDQSIDAARAKRLQVPATEAAPRAAHPSPGADTVAPRPDSAPPANRATPLKSPPNGPNSPFQRRVG